jgi:hypothetical protein
MPYKLEQVAESLRISKTGQSLCMDWGVAMSLPVKQALSFLEPGFIIQSGKYVFLTDEIIQELVDFVGSIARDEYLLSFFWYCYYRILNDPTLILSWEEQWPPLDDYLGQEAGLLNVLVMISAVPQVQETYRHLCIPENIVRDTLMDLRPWMETDLYYQRYRRWGITPWIARWLCHHWQGKLLQLGRLQFSQSVFQGHLSTYRHGNSRKLFAIADDGIRFCEDGNAWSACCGNDPGGWISSLILLDGVVIGNPITPDGFAHQKTCRLALNERELVLEPGNEVLTFLIPASGPLRFEECGESFQQALEFFPRYFPEFKFRGFYSGAWLLDPRLQTLLPPESNIVRLQRELYLYPGLQGDNQQIYQRIFGWGVIDINSVPWETSLQNIIGQYLNGGGHFHGGYSFMVKEDLSWGHQVYLHQMGQSVCRRWER